jgi:hypothetical protein
MSDAPTTRRDFAKHLAALAVTPLAAVPARSEVDDPPPATPKPTPPDPATATADALLEVVRIRYGKHLNDEQLKAVHKSLQRGAASSAALRRIPLANGDEPSFTFHADLP